MPFRTGPQAPGSWLPPREGDQRCGGRCQRPFNRREITKSPSRAAYHTRRTRIDAANAWLAARSGDDTVKRPTTLAPLYAISKGLAPGDAMIEAGLAG